jgi:hypothetical protein
MEGSMCGESAETANGVQYSDFVLLVPVGTPDRSMLRCFEHSAKLLKTLI